MAADSTLVQAAFNLGKSRIPGDFSDIFNKQYEGLIEYQKQRYKGIGDTFQTLAKEGGKFTTAVLAQKKESIEADNLLFENTYEETATNVSTAKLSEAGKHYETEGAGQNTDHINAANNKFEDLKSQLSVLSDKVLPTKADKKLQVELRKKAETMKKNLVEAKAGVISRTSAYKEGFVNNKLSFEGSPNEQLLFAQVHDPNANLEALGIRTFWDDNEQLQYEYTPNRLQKEYEINNPENIGETYSGETLTISAKKLASMMVLKDIKGNNSANALITKAASMASETIGKTKNLAHKDFNRVMPSIYNDYKSLFLDQNTNIQDLTTREILVGNTNRTYVDDLGSNTIIDETLINQLGIGSDKFSAEEWRDGKIDANELAMHEGAKAELIQKLTNPQTQSEREVAADELAKYWTAQAKTEFDYIREQSKSGGGGGNVGAEDTLAGINGRMFNPITGDDEWVGNKKVKGKLTKYGAYDYDANNKKREAGIAFPDMFGNMYVPVEGGWKLKGAGSGKNHQGKYAKGDELPKGKKVGDEYDIVYTTIEAKTNAFGGTYRGAKDEEASELGLNEESMGNLTSEEIIEKYSK